MKLKGKVALITGGGTGIGAAIAKRFVAEGAKVCITGRRPKKLEEVLQELPAGSGISYTGSVTDPGDVDRTLSTVINWSGRLDILINNAGLTTFGAIAGLDISIWRETIDTNLTGPFLMMRASIPHMIRGGGGSIINISSLAALRCPPEFAAYCSSKAGLNMLTQQVALDYAPHKIRCNAICPGWVRTPMGEEDMEKLAGKLGISLEQAFTTAVKNVPQKRMSDPSEIAAICVFLASDEAPYMTGSVVVADGGASIVDPAMLAFQK